MTVYQFEIDMLVNTLLSNKKHDPPQISGKSRSDRIGNYALIRVEDVPQN